MWDTAALFVTLAERGSFTAAAKGTGMSPVTFARRISELETRLGLVLVLRDTGGVTLTARGQEFLDLVAPNVRDMTRAMATAARIARMPGRTALRISGTEPVIAEVVAPRLAELLEKTPELRIDLRVDAATADLSASEAEIALRFAKPAGDTFRVRRLTTFAMGVWRHVDHPDSLAGARFVGYDDSFGDIAERRWMQAAGVAVRTDVVTSSTRAMLAIIRSGIAVGILPDIIADRADDLRRVSDAPTVPPRPLWMLMHPDVSRQQDARQVATWLGRLF